MTYTVRVRTLPGSPMLCEYSCPVHGVFEQLVERDANGDPPATKRCPESSSLQHPPVGPITGAVCGMCGRESPLVLSAPSIKFWSRDPVALGRASKSDERDPRALNTDDYASGKITKTEWRKKQAALRMERRHQRKLKSGRISRRIQVG